jgi:nucleoid-associated protein YgaU
MDKANLRIISSTPEKLIPVMFNPTDYEITRNMKYADVSVPGLQTPLIQFVYGESQTLKLDLFLDSTDRTVTPGVPPIGDATLVNGALDPTVERRLKALRTLVTIDSELHAPPVVRFEWSGNRFEGVVNSYTEKFTMFDDTGRIIRARVTLQLKSYASAETLFRDTRQNSPDRTKTRVLKAGERLEMIAADEYGDPTLWAVIARANGITRPRILSPGMLLVVPPLT